MKHTSTAQYPICDEPSRSRRLAAHLARPFGAVLFAVLLLGPTALHAAECPASSPEDPQERRKLAKEWFGIAEAAESASNDAEATRAYACSYKMVAHPFTAFNLGRVAERSGDNELALKMFKAYLTLKPDAADRDDVKARIKGIEEKIAAAQSAPSEAPTEGATAEQPSEPQPTPPPEELAPPPVAPPPAVTKRPEPEPEPEPPSRALEWTVGGVSAATLVVGIILNLDARSKMSACQTDAAKGSLGTANNECESAKPLAYTSYAMFAIAAAGAATDALLLILRQNDGPSRREEASLGIAPLLGGGAALTARGRF